MTYRKKLIYLTIMMLITIFMTGCAKKEGNTIKKYEGPFSEINGTYAGVDSLGRVLAVEDGAPFERENKYIGLFYFLWHGQHGTPGPYDNSKIAMNPEAVKSDIDWIKNGGGPVGSFHFWGEPLFGYYTYDDVWVMHKHVQMLTDANVDFLVFDTTNGYAYAAQALKLLKVLDFYSKQGWNVPKIAFYTNTDSGKTMNVIYNTIYKTHKEYSHLWFNLDGKPMIIGHPDDSILSKEAKDFFRIKKSQWPNEGKDGAYIHHEDAFPWMSFEDKQWVFKNTAGENEVMSVSMAQHNQTLQFSTSAWYDPTTNRTRSYHNGENDQSENAYLYGYNFADQFEYAIDKDPKIIFITGWNEWIGQRQPSKEGDSPIVFWDCADPNSSRDAEPMKGGFGDNYYMQMMYYIRKFKGIKPRVDVGANTTIDINGGFVQWDTVTANYKDYQGDIIDRNANGFGTGKKATTYKDTTGRNDIDIMKVARDSDYIYFFVSTIDDITDASDANWMNLFINSGNSANSNWEGYDFVINRVQPDGNKAIIEKSNGNWSWTEVGKTEFKIEGNKMMLKVKKDVLGIKNDDLLDIRFKWADNYQLGENGEGDIFSFYLNGDCAPYGRLNYIFSEKDLKK